MNACYNQCATQCFKTLSSSSSPSLSAARLAAAKNVKKVVRVLAQTDQEHVVNSCFVNYPSGDCKDPGFEAYLVYDALKSLGYHIEWVPAATEEETVGQILADNYDMIIPTVSFTFFYRAQAVYADYGLADSLAISKPVMFDQFLFVHREDVLDQRSTDSLIISSNLNRLSVWLCLIGVCIILFPLNTLIKRLLHRALSKFQQPGTTTLGLGRQSSVLIRITESGKASWFVALTIIFGLYTNFLAITLSIPPSYPRLFSTLDEYADLLLSRKCRVVTLLDFKDDPKDNAYALYLHPPLHSHESKTDAHAKIRRAYKLNPPIFVQNNSELLSRVLRDQSNCLIGIIYEYVFEFYRIQIRTENLKVIRMRDGATFLGGFVYNRGRAGSVIEHLDTLFAGVGESSNSVFQLKKAAYFKAMYGTRKYRERLHPELLLHQRTGKNGWMPIKLLQLLDIFWITMAGVTVAIVIAVLEKLITTIQSTRRVQLRMGEISL